MLRGALGYYQPNSYYENRLPVYLSYGFPRKI